MPLNRRFAVVLGCLLLVLPVSFRPASGQDGTPVPLVNIDRVALVTPADRTNQGWDQQAADGIEAVASGLGIEADVVDNAGYDDISPVLRDLASDGADLIICHASGYQTTCPEFAAAEGVPVAVIENPGSVSEGLVSDIETQAQEAAYLAGVLAGKSTVTGIVAIVVSGEPPTWNFMSVGFAEGLKAARPDAKLLYSVIGEAAYDDAAGAKRVTDAVLGAGADVVFGMGDGASFGMIESVSAHNAENPDQPARFIDVIGDKSADNEDGSILTSVLFDFAPTYDQMLHDLDTGQFGKVYTLDLRNGGVRLNALPDDLAPEVANAVAQAEADILSGDIVVSAIGDAAGMNARLDELFPE
jgi:simple sugar transport system substrate-binding protein